MLITLILIALLTYFLWSYYSRIKCLPPGPFPLPLVGNLFQLAWGLFRHRNLVKVMREWHEKYGPVVTWHLGPLATVQIADYQLAVDAMVKNGSAFADRKKLPMMDVVRNGRGVLMANGKHWQEQRRFTLHTLRNFGLGRNIMQDRVMIEYNYRTELLDKEIDKASGRLSVDPFSFLERTIGNIINRILFSDGFTEEAEARFFKLKREMDDVFDKPNLGDFFIHQDSEWFQNIPFVKKRVQHFAEPLNAVLDFIKEQISTRKNEIEGGRHETTDEGEDLVDAFLLEMKKKDAGESFEEETLAITALDLWRAGQETTVTTLYWALTYLLLHPQVIVKLQKELDSVTGRSRPLGLSDKPNTPYLNAVILEILRLSSILPISLWRSAVEDTQINGFKIPKGTAVTAQSSLIMSDPKIFPEPEKFRPERFLEADLDHFVSIFGLGKRACLGESLARTEMFLIIGNFLLSYDMEMDPQFAPQMMAIKEIGGVRKAFPFHAIISRRL